MKCKIQQIVEFLDKDKIHFLAVDGRTREVLSHTTFYTEYLKLKHTNVPSVAAERMLNESMGTKFSVEEKC